MIDFKCKAVRPRLLRDKRGFTLVELMIALAMSGIIVAAVYAAYNIQQRSYYSQGQVVEMQQNLRAAMELISGDIRMAAYDPDGEASANIPVATPGRLQVLMDLNDDGDAADANESVTFDISDDDATDGTYDGISDSGSGNLDRNSQAIAENIQAIDFHYTLEDGSDVSNPDTTQRDKIQSVHISILAVAEQRDAKYINATTYTIRPGLDWGPFGDNFRRRLLTSTVYIRNRGL